MQEQQDINDVNSYDDLSTWADFETDTANAVKEPYKPPRVPLGLPHVVRFATESGPLLPWEVRSLVMLVGRYGNPDGRASVAVSTLCDITNTGSKNTIENRLKLACAVGILRKEPGKGGKDRKSNTYVFLGKERNWEPLPMDRPGTNPIVALAQVRRHNEELLDQNQQLTARVAYLEARVAQLSNGAAIGHDRVTDGPESQHSGAPDHSYETAGPGDPPGPHGAIGHSEVANGSEEEPSETTSYSYENAGPGDSPGPHGTIVHSEVTDGPDSPGEAQEYLPRRARVEELVMEHAAYYERSFTGGVLSAINYFSRSAETEQELLYQVDIRRRARESAEDSSGADPPSETAGPSEYGTNTGRREVEYCPDCDSPYTTRSGAEYCPDCTDRRRRQGEA